MLSSSNLRGCAPQIGGVPLHHSGGAYAESLSRAPAGRWGPWAHWRRGVGSHLCPPLPWVWLRAVVVGSWVVARTGRKVCVGRFCVTSGLWLRRREVTRPQLASVVIGGACSVIALAGDCVGGRVRRCRVLTRGSHWRR